MSEQEQEQTNGLSAAPPTFHQALDELFRWMAENNQPDGRITISEKRPASGELPLCADIEIIIYRENPGDDDGDENAET